MITVNLNVLNGDQPVYIDVSTNPPWRTVDPQDLSGLLVEVTDVHGTSIHIPAGNRIQIGTVDSLRGREDILLIQLVNAAMISHPCTITVEWWAHHRLQAVTGTAHPSNGFLIVMNEDVRYV